MRSIALYLRGHRFLRVLLAVAVLSIVAAVTDGQIVSVPQVMDQYLLDVPVRPFLAVLHAALILWALPHDTLLLEAQSLRSLAREDLFLLGAAAAPSLGVAVAAATVRDEQFAAAWVTDIGVATTLAIAAASVVGIARAAIVPALCVTVLAAFSGHYRLVGAAWLPFFGRPTLIAAMIAAVISLLSSRFIQVIRKRSILT